MSEMKWEKEYEQRWIAGRSLIDGIMNEAHQNGYEVFDITNREQSKHTRNTVATGTRIIFRKIQISLKPRTLDQQLRDFFSTPKKTEKDRFAHAKVYPFCEIHESVVIGDNTIIGSHTFIGKDVVIKDLVRIQGHCYIPTGVTIERGAFIAPSVTFLNDKYPPSKGKDWGKILVRKYAVIGGGACILPNVTIGEGAIIGAGSVVTKNVFAGETWVGNPAKKMKQ